MRVFVTGATGFIGASIVRDLVASGHHVVGLARSQASAATLANLGAEPHAGDLSDLDSLIAGVRKADGAIHTAFNHDFSQYLHAIEADARAVEAMSTELEGSGKPLVIASGTLMVSHAHPCNESDMPAGPEVPRAAAERLMVAAAGRGVRSSIVRLPPSVHDRTRAGFVTALAGFARQAGVSAYVDAGANRWPAVHRLDAARLFVLALEHGAPGARFHAVAERGIMLRDIAEAIGDQLGLPSRSVTGDEAARHFGWLARFISVDNETSSDLTRDALGWRPQHPGLLADLVASRSFQPEPVTSGD
jgi:nucleoside-diphosphate-sugar epimerase